MMVGKEGKKIGDGYVEEEEKKAIYIHWALPALPIKSPEPNLEQGRQAERALIERIWEGVSVCNIFSLSR